MLTRTAAIVVRSRLAAEVDSWAAGSSRRVLLMGFASVENEKWFAEKTALRPR
jgi:hypothetical protein